MAKLKKGDLVIDSSVPAEIVNLKAQGFRVVKPTGDALVGESGPELVDSPKPAAPRK